MVCWDRLKTIPRYLCIVPGVIFSWSYFFVNSSRSQSDFRALLLNIISDAKMSKNDPTKLVHIKMEPEIATMLIEVDPTMIPYVRKDGSIIAELKKALYSCIESAVLWYEELSHTLMSL